jgi:thioredoxin 1
MADVIASVAQDNQNSINVFKINTDSNLNTATKYSVSSLPTVLFFKDGEPKERLVGLLPKSSLINNIEKYL